LNNNKLINEKLVCAFLWSVLPSIMKMHGPKNKITLYYVHELLLAVLISLTSAVRNEFCVKFEYRI